MSAPPPPLSGLPHTAPPPLPLYTAPPPRPNAVKPKKIKRVLTPEESINAEVRSNIIMTAVFLTLVFLILWGTRTPAGTEVVNQAGATLVVLGDIVLFLLVTIEPFAELRRRKAAK